jgi:hypothetical protein
MSRIHFPHHHTFEQMVPWLIRGLALAAFAVAAWAAWQDFTQV